jgi:hypothetical protein
MKHTVLQDGELKKVDELNPDHLRFEDTRQLFSTPSNLITGISGTSGGRILLGAKATMQAISLVDKQRALVESSSSNDKQSTHELFGKNYLSVTAIKRGKVESVSQHDIKIKNDDGTSNTYQLYHNFAIGRKTFITNTAKVKPGDMVKEKQVIATSNYTDDDGNMALGTNLTTAILPHRSSNFEDAYAVTETGAKKLEAEEMIKVSVERKFGVDTDKNKFISLFPNKYTNQQIANIDDKGIARVGAVLKTGDPVILAFSPKALKSTDLALGKLSKVLKHAFKDNSETWDYEHNGVVVDAAENGDLSTIHIKTSRSLQTGDKLANVWGAKGVAVIIPDAQAPTLPNGKPVDIILNSMSITSRVAPALAVSLGLGKLAQKRGETIKMDQFRKDSSIKNVIDTLKKHNISDTEQLYDPVTGRHIEAVVGPLYFSRLVHIGEDKLSTRSQGTGYSFDNQPSKSHGEGLSAKRIGNLGTTALLSHDAKNVLEDLGTVKGTKNDEFWRAIKLGQTPPSPKVPFIFNKFIASLQGAGVNVKREGNHYDILPMVDKDTLALSKGAINKPTMFKPHQEELVHEVGGLFDPTKTGLLGDNFNHIDLNFAVPNPISEDYLRKMLKVTKNDYNNLVVSGEIESKLKGINVDSKIAEYKNYLSSGKKTDRDDSVKLLEFLINLKKHNLTPIDLLLHKVPIIPAQYRPASKMGDVMLTSDVNNLYKDLILNNNILKDTKDVPDELKDKLKLGQYNAVKAVFGLGQPINKKHVDKNIKGLLATMLGFKGGTAKSTMFQAKVVNKSLDLVGRAVLTPDTRLDVDQASVPQDMLWQIYKPFIIRRLVMKGVPAVNALDYVKKHNSLAVQSLKEELEVRPGVITRDPIWHKLNVLGFKLLPNPNKKDKTIKLNPLVFKGFGADNDGDQININVPATEEARKEILEKMMPSKNLLSPKTFSPTLVPSNESALGMYGMSTENKHNTPKKFKTEQEVMAAYNKGDLEEGDNVTVGTD